MNKNDKTAATFPLTLATMDPEKDDEGTAWQIGIINKPQKAAANTNIVDNNQGGGDNNQGGGG